MDDSKSARKQYLINPRFQITLIGYFLLLFIITTLIYYNAHDYILWKFKQIALASGLEEGHVFFTAIRNSTTSMNVRFILTSIISLFVLVGGGLFLSHKIAGPIYRICEHLKKGKKEKIEFRKRDFFKELESNFNSFIDKV